MAKALIAYATRTKKTEEIGALIAEGMRISGVDVNLQEAKDIKNKEDLEGYDAFVFGSATYHGEMMQAMKTMLFLAEQADLKGKAGGAFGAFGWSGEAPDRIFDTMKHIFEMEMVGGALRLKKASVQGGMQAAQDYGKQIVKKLEG